MLYRNRIRVRDAAQRLEFSAERVFSEGSVKSERLCSRLDGAITKLFSDKENAFKAVAARLDASSPLGILQKGYAKVYSGQKPLYSAADTVSGQEIDVYMRDGTIHAQTLSVKLIENKEK